MKVIGIDPGTINCGYGIIEFNNNEFIYIKSGVINLNSKLLLPQKLNKIFDELQKLIKTFKPDDFAIETAFFGKNVQSLLKIGYARGVSLLLAEKSGLVIGEYSPREIKKAIVGNGNASKEQVQFMVNKLLNIKPAKMKYDETDALGVAICHAFNSTSIKSRASNWKKFIQDNPDRIID